MSLRILPDQGSRRINMANLILRLLQLLLALIVMITYIALTHQLGIPLSKGWKGPVVSTSLTLALEAPQQLTTLQTGHSLRSRRPLHYHSRCIPVHPHPVRLQTRRTGVHLVRQSTILALLYASTHKITTH